MQLLDRVKSNVKLCGIEIAFTGDVKPSSINGWQPFYNSSITAQFHNTNASIPRIDFFEESIQNNAGISYKQKVVFRIPISDKNRSERIALLQKTKFVKIKQTNGLDLVIGRNDYYQNVPPAVKIKSNEQFIDIEIESQSIFPSGFIPSTTIYGFPSQIPITLY